MEGKPKWSATNISPDASKYVFLSQTILSKTQSWCLIATWWCVDVECTPDSGDDPWVGVARKSSSSSSSMSQASLVLRANSWKLEAFLDLRLLNLGFVLSLGYLQMDSEWQAKRNGKWKCLRASLMIQIWYLLQKMMEYRMIKTGRQAS